MSASGPHVCALQWDSVRHSTGEQCSPKSWLVFYTFFGCSPRITRTIHNRQTLIHSLGRVSGGVNVQRFVTENLTIHDVASVELARVGVRGPAATPIPID